MTVVLLDPCLNGTQSPPSVNLTTFTREAVNARCFQAEVILIPDGAKETGNLPRQET
jgi:hypothetical protein